MSPSPRAPQSTLALLVLILGLRKIEMVLNSMSTLKRIERRWKDERVSPPYRLYSQDNPRDDMLVVVPRSSADNVTVRWMDVFVENENALELVHVSKKKTKITGLVLTRSSWDVLNRSDLTV